MSALLEARGVEKDYALGAPQRGDVLLEGRPLAPAVILADEPSGNLDEPGGNADVLLSRLVSLDV